VGAALGENSYAKKLFFPGFGWISLDLPLLAGRQQAQWDVKLAKESAEDRGLKGRK
jgi:hypothetical protein